MMSDVEWTNMSVVRLVEEYKKRRELWDRHHDLYRSQAAKYDAWASMARVFECDIADLRKKLNSVFASYRREKAKVRGGTKSSWFLYQTLNFLHNHIDQPEVKPQSIDSTNDSQMEEDQTSDELEAEDYDDQNVIIVKEEPVVEYVHAKSLPHLKNSKRLKRTIKRKIINTNTHVSPTNNTNHIDSKLLEMLRLLRKSSEISKKKDECDSFGEYIAVSLRKHDERTQSMIKQAINNILFEQEMKKYSHGQYVEIETDENPLVLGETEVVNS